MTIAGIFATYYPVSCCAGDVENAGLATDNTKLTLTEWSMTADKFYYNPG